MFIMSLIYISAQRPAVLHDVLHSFPQLFQEYTDLYTHCMHAKLEICNCGGHQWIDIHGIKLHVNVFIAILVFWY
jgi:hypothetical protein